MSRNYSLSQTGLDLIKRWEGCRLTAYQDIVGIWTIGYGWTNPVDGIRIYRGMTITQAKAESLLKQGVQSYVNGVNAKLTRDATQNQFDAMCSLCYNIGIGAFQSSTLLANFNAGNVSGASNQFLAWVKAEGQTIQGLVNRRKDEKALFDKTGGSASVTSNSITGDTYTVKSGDSLSTIASRWGTTVDNLVKVNGIKDKNVISVGQVLRKSTASTTGFNKSSYHTTRFNYIKIKKTDFLYSEKGLSNPIAKVAKDTILPVSALEYSGQYPRFKALGGYITSHKDNVEEYKIDVVVNGKVRFNSTATNYQDYSKIPKDKLGGRYTVTKIEKLAKKQSYSNYRYYLKELGKWVLGQDIFGAL